MSAVALRMFQDSLARDSIRRNNRGLPPAHSLTDPIAMKTRGSSFPSTESRASRTSSESRPF
jgi:hypothetical protein